MKEITLTKGRIALIDDDDFELVMQYKWFYRTKGYAWRLQRKGEPKPRSQQSMHRLIMGCPEGYHIDHINGDKLDNRRSNLRTCTRQQNASNMSIRKNNKTGLKGVCKQGNSYVAYIKQNYKTIYLGSYKSPEEAAAAYDSAATERFGNFARPNSRQNERNSK